MARRKRTGKKTKEKKFKDEKNKKKLGRFLFIDFVIVPLINLLSRLAGESTLRNNH
jgi:uncharacterized membrane protein